MMDIAIVVVSVAEMDIVYPRYRRREVMSFMIRENGPIGWRWEVAKLPVYDGSWRW